MASCGCLKEIPPLPAMLTGADCLISGHFHYSVIATARMCSFGVQVVGLVTRKDLTEPNAKLVLGRKANLGLASGATDALVHDEGLPFIPYGEHSLSFTVDPNNIPLSYHMMIECSASKQPTHVNPDHSTRNREL